LINAFGEQPSAGDRQGRARFDYVPG